MPGFFSRVGTYMAGHSPTVRSAMAGGAMGAAYGAMSSDTSILGGAAAGAMMGAGAYRYGVKPAMAVERMGLGSGMGFAGSLMANGRAMGQAMSNAMMRDGRQIKLAANKGYSKIRGMGFGFGGGLA